MKANAPLPAHAALGAWIRLLKVHNLVLKQARTRLSDHCTLPQFDVLAQLSREVDGTPITELSRRLLVTAGNTTGLIDRLERDGFVERKADARDRRITRVRLTEKGQRVASDVLPMHASDMEQWFSSLNRKEIEQLRKLLDKLVRGLEDENAG